MAPFSSQTFVTMPRVRSGRRMGPERGRSPIRVWVFVAGYGLLTLGRRRPPVATSSAWFRAGAGRRVVLVAGFGEAIWSCSRRRASRAAGAIPEASYGTRHDLPRVHLAQLLTHQD